MKLFLSITLLILFFCNAGNAQYKKASFLFVDVWESPDKKETQKKVAKFINDNKYPFNVLYDSKNEVVKQYQIESIPTQIIIDKNGNILAFNPSEEALEQILEKNQ